MQRQGTNSRMSNRNARSRGRSKDGRTGSSVALTPFCGQCISPAEQDLAPAHSTGLRGWCHGWIVSCRAMRLLPGLQGRSAGLARRCSFVTPVLVPNQHRTDYML